MARVVFAAPLYEKARHLPAAVESLLAQGGADLVLLLVDDASSDETPAVCRRYVETDDRVSYHRNPARLGLIGCWQRALELARERHPEAEYFAWASDHDVWQPGWLEALLAQLDPHPEAVLAYPQSVRIGDEGKRLRPEPPWRWDTAGQSDPAERFRRFARHAGAGDMVYGLFRLSALAGLAFPRALAPDRLLLAELSLLGEFRQVPEILWHRRYVAKVSSRRQRASLFPSSVPAWARVPWPLAHSAVLVARLGVRREGGRDVGRLTGVSLAGRYLTSAVWRQVRKQLLRPVGWGSHRLRDRLAVESGRLTDVRPSIDIGRPPEEVFVFLSDPAKLTTWQDAEEVTQLTPGPVGPGTRFREVHRRLGRRRAQVTEVVALVPGRRLEIRMVEGPPVDGRWDLEPIAAGTRLTMTPTVRLQGVLGALAPLAELATALAMRRAHLRLKRVLEGD